MMNFLAYSTDVPADLAGKLTYGLMVTIIGVLIVFAVLVLIMLVIYLFQMIFGEKKPKVSLPEAPKPVSLPAVQQVPAAPAPKQEELVAAIAAATAMAQEELIVVLAAAVAAQEGCDPASSRYRIRSFRRIL